VQNGGGRKGGVRTRAVVFREKKKPRRDENGRKEKGSFPRAEEGVE